MFLDSFCSCPLLLLSSSSKNVSLLTSYIPLVILSVRIDVFVFASSILGSTDCVLSYRVHVFLVGEFGVVCTHFECLIQIWRAVVVSGVVANFKQGECSEVLFPTIPSQTSLPFSPFLYYPLPFSPSLPLPPVLPSLPYLRSRVL